MDGPSLRIRQLGSVRMSDQIDSRTDERENSGGRDRQSSTCGRLSDKTTSVDGPEPEESANATADQNSRSRPWAPDRRDPTRRAVLKWTVGGVVATAGCASERAENPDDETISGSVEGTGTSFRSERTEADRVSDIDQVISGTLSYGDIVQSELTEEIPYHEEFNGYYERYTFEGSAGDSVVVEMVTDGEFGDPYLLMLDQRGQLLVVDDDSAGGLDAQIQTELPRGGTYSIIATSYTDHGLFSYVLGLREGG